jgi:hypothetical protein
MRHSVSGPRYGARLPWLGVALALGAACAPASPCLATLGMTHASFGPHKAEHMAWGILTRDGAHATNRLQLQYSGRVPDDVIAMVYAMMSAASKLFADGHLPRVGGEAVQVASGGRALGPMVLAQVMCGGWGIPWFCTRSSTERSVPRNPWAFSMVAEA